MAGNGSETRERVEAAMATLPRKTREIFLAKRLDDLSYSEIASRTGLTEEQVRHHMYRAISSLDRHVNQVGHRRSIL